MSIPAQAYRAWAGLATKDFCRNNIEKEKEVTPGGSST